MLRQSNKIFIGDWAKIRIMVFNILVNIFHTFTDSVIINKQSVPGLFSQIALIMFSLSGKSPHTISCNPD